MEQTPPRLRRASDPLPETSRTAERPSRQGPRRAPPRTPEASASRRAESASSSGPRSTAEQAAIPAAAAARSPPAGHGRPRPGLHDAPGAGHLAAPAPRSTSDRAWPRHALSAVGTLAGLEQALQVRQNFRPTARHGLDEFRSALVDLMRDRELGDIAVPLDVEGATRIAFGAQFRHEFVAP